jgi:CheY-like chemotaxis protein
MRRCGCLRVFTAGNGVEALAILDVEEIDVMVSDVRMPLMDGLTLLKRIKERGRSIPGIVFVSGFSDVDLCDLYASGVEAVLPKPITIAELEAVVMRSLAERAELWEMRTMPVPAVGVALEPLGASLAMFGRGGFCARADRVLERGRIRFSLPIDNSAEPACGYGLVRWSSKVGFNVGVELEFLEPASREAVLRLVRGHTGMGFIPCPA